jgi:hypothetical protein
MTTATKERIRLDKFLRSYGSGMGILTRIVGVGHNQSSYSVSVRAHVHDYTPDELTEQIIQGDSHVIISSTEIIAAQWPGSQPTPPVLEDDLRVARRGDKFVFPVNNRQRNVEEGQGIYFDDQLIRIEFRIRGLQ